MVIKEISSNIYRMAIRSMLILQLQRVGGKTSRKQKENFNLFANLASSFI